MRPVFCLSSAPHHAGGIAMSHTIRVTDVLESLGVELASFVADVTVNLIPESGDGWNEPREPAHAELSSVKQVDGPFIEPLKLTLWADLWVEANQYVIRSDAMAF